MQLDSQARSQNVMVECPTMIIGFSVRVPLSEASQKCLDEVVEHHRRPMFPVPDWQPFTASNKDSATPQRQDASNRPNRTSPEANRPQQPNQRSSGGDGSSANKKPIEPKRFLEFSDLVW